jgi:hypothetical protein
VGISDYSDQFTEHGIFHGGTDNVKASAYLSFIKLWHSHDSHQDLKSSDQKQLFVNFDKAEM